MFHGDFVQYVVDRPLGQMIVRHPPTNLVPEGEGVNLILFARALCPTRRVSGPIGVAGAPWFKRGRCRRPRSGASSAAHHRDNRRLALCMVQRLSQITTSPLAASGGDTGTFVLWHAPLAHRATRRFLAPRAQQPVACDWGLDRGPGGRFPDACEPSGCTASGHRCHGGPRTAWQRACPSVSSYICSTTLSSVDHPLEIGRRQIGIGQVHVGELGVTSRTWHLEAIEHGQRTGLAHEAVIGMPMGPVDKPLAVAEFIAIFAGYDIHLTAVSDAARAGIRTTGVPKIVMASRKATGQRYWSRMAQHRCRARLRLASSASPDRAAH